MSYGFERHIHDITVDDAIALVTDALAKEGFGVLTRIDVDQKLHDKLDVDFRRYVILGACNPRLAYTALTADPQIGLLLPCNVVVQQDGARDVLVSIADPEAMVRLTHDRAIAPVADEASKRLHRVMDGL